MYQKIQIKPTIDKPNAIAIILSKSIKKLPSEYRALDKSFNGLISKINAMPEFTGEAGSVFVCPVRNDQTRLYVIGSGGKTDSISKALRVGCSKLVKKAKEAQLKSVDLQLISSCLTQGVGRAIGEGLGLALFNFIQFKGTATKTPSTKLGTLNIAVGKTISKEVNRGLKVATSTNLARELAATPPNVAHPAYLEKVCKRIGRQVGLKVSVIDYKKAQQLGMGGLVNVGKAGSTPPRLIIMEHCPKGSSKKAPVVLVGKAITFDTGGYSLKPTSGIVGMKYDKCGGCAVIGAMHAIGSLNIPQRVVGLISTAENMVDSTAYRPDDIITMYNGVTVEIVSTDAEGRLVLGDALAYGCKTYKPKAIIDLATLTGGVGVALGSLCAACFCDDSKLTKSLVDAGEEVGERLWSLPNWPEYRKLLKSTHADIVNSGGREAHAIQGAAFLSYFVAKDGDFKSNDSLPWAHLDIAAMADVGGDSDPSGLFPKGPTGFGVRLLVKALEAMK